MGSNNHCKLYYARSNSFLVINKNHYVAFLIEQQASVKLCEDHGKAPNSCEGMDFVAIAVQVSEATVTHAYVEMVKIVRHNAHGSMYTKFRVVLGREEK